MNYLYLGKRLVIAFLSLLVVSSVVFAMTMALPGSAAEIILGTQQTEQSVQQVREEMGLDRPLSERYVDFVIGVFTLDFGDSLISDQPVTEMLIPRLIRTLQLAVVAMLLSIVLAIPMGVIAAAKRDTLSDTAITNVSYVGVSLPSFVSASLLLLFFTTGPLGIFPSGGYEPLSEGFIPWVRHLALPAIALNFVVFAYVLRQTRSSMIETLESDYIRTARLKGLAERSVLARHALRNGLLPTVTVLAINFGWMMGSVVIVEEIFSYPGMGRLIVQAIAERDLPVIQAGILVPTAAFVFANLLADVVYTVLDPRIELGEK
ncbi:ABC transporter permease [Haloarculaceae archaeon H-GB2-1]|nr:ABC transporter permease [Haloarculaceae archaeon H-GB1-1]MEA5387891.1 ABC transporter permease [Haloarculaceae archaeon H-GB11]MEA5409384.1 ABC transporter permease [Haloarculaceae archaeon H-GB2-1]